MKKIIYIFVFVIIIYQTVSYAEINLEDTISEQESSFGIKDFLKEAEQYMPESMNEITITDMFNSAVQGKIDNSKFINQIIKLIESPIKSTIKTIINILLIVLIHSLLKTLTENLESTNVSKIVYYVQYILIVTIIMANFTDILSSINNTIENLVGFSESLIPILITLMLYTGSLTTTAVIEPIILFLIEFIANTITTLILPTISLITVIMIVSKISDRVQLNKLSHLMKSSIVWFLGITLTVFVGVISLEGTLTSSVDGITAKTTKAAVSSLIPIVGKVLGDGVDAILGCGVVLKNAVGIMGVLIIIAICILPIIKLATLSIMYSLTSSLIEPIAEEKIVKLLGEIGEIFKLLLAVLCSISTLLIVGITLTIKISNSGMMYR